MERAVMDATGKTRADYIAQAISAERQSKAYAEEAEAMRLAAELVPLRDFDTCPTGMTYTTPDGARAALMAIMEVLSDDGLSHADRGGIAFDVAQAAAWPQDDAEAQRRVQIANMAKWLG